MSKQDVGSLAVETMQEWFPFVLERAKGNLAVWGRQDEETLALCVSEESGELAKAVLKWVWDKGKETDIIRETVDLAALCFQILLRMPVKDFEKATKRQKSKKKQGK